MATILIVDDERLIRESLSRLLRSQEAIVYVAATAGEAIRISESEPLDLAIVDWMLNDKLHGLQLIQAMRESKPTLPALVVTGYLSGDVQTRVNSLPNAWVLAKPCGFDELMQAIDVAIGSNRS